MAANNYSRKPGGNYGHGQTKKSHYVYSEDPRLAIIKRRARRNPPTPLPVVDLGPAKKPPDPEKQLSYHLVEDGRRDRNW